MKDEKTLFEIRVHNDKGTDIYITSNPDIFYNFAFGNTPVIFFTTVEGHEIMIPPTTIIEQRRYHRPLPTIDRR